MLLLPDGHPFAHASSARAPSGTGSSTVPERAAPSARETRPTRIAILNIMPQLEAYEPSLLSPLAAAASRGRVVEPVFVRLESHTYTSSDAAHLERFYRTWREAVREAPIDGVVLTGAPVEELAFEDVRYWPELDAILGEAQATSRSTLGLCWGGMALAKRVGVEKILFPRKLFGVFRNRVLEDDHPLLRPDPGASSFPCAHSRHSGIADDALERAARDGRVCLLSHGAETGYTIFEAPDHSWIGHLGHPEYEGARIAFEWARDQELGRTDVPPPHAFDPAAPTTSWRSHREDLFARWLDLIRARTTRASRDAHT